MLKHFELYCPTAKYLMKTDDDMFVNNDVILNIIRNASDENAAIGLRIKQNNPIRHSPSKWNMPYWLYANDKYPTYLSGTGYILPGIVMFMKF